MSTLVVLPVVTPLLAAALCVVAWSSVRVQRAITVTAMTALLVLAVTLLVRVDGDGIGVAELGGWEAPFGIVLVADLFSAMMVVITGVIGIVAAFYSLATIDPERERFGFWALFNALIAGVSGAFLAGDIFNLYVWFEVMLISSFVLLALGNERPQIEASIKYVALNLVASAIFLSGAGLTYGMTGTLNMADLARRLPEVENTGLVTAIGMLFMVAFGIKAAVFPLFFWLPASYHTPPPAVSGLFAGLLTKVGVYALIRFFTLMFGGDTGFTHNLILWIAGLTMAGGVLGAVAQHEMRRILAFHSVSQIGYMVVGLGLLTPLGLAASVFFIWHHSVVKSALFFVSGMVMRLRGTAELSLSGGLYTAHLSVAVLFGVPALSLAGLPPFGGFVAKLAVVRASIERGEWAIMAVALGVGLLTVYSMAKIWFEVFWKPSPASESEEADQEGAYGLSIIAPVAVLAVLTTGMGFGAEYILSLSLRAADQLLDPAGYAAAVLGGGGT